MGKAAGVGEGEGRGVGEGQGHGKGTGYYSYCCAKFCTSCLCLFGWPMFIVGCILVGGASSMAGMLTVGLLFLLGALALTILLSIRIIGPPYVDVIDVSATATATATANTHITINMSPGQPDPGQPQYGAQPSQPLPGQTQHGAHPVQQQPSNEAAYPPAYQQY